MTATEFLNRLAHCTEKSEARELEAFLAQAFVSAARFEALAGKLGRWEKTETHGDCYFKLFPVLDPDLYAEKQEEIREFEEWTALADALIAEES